MLQFLVLCVKTFVEWHSVMLTVWLTASFSFILLCYPFLVEMPHQIKAKMLTAVWVLRLYRNRDTKLEERDVSSGTKTPAGEESGRWVWRFVGLLWTSSALNFVCYMLSDEESVLMVWNGMLPMEVKELKRHCDKREQIAVRMREQFQAETLLCMHLSFFIPNGFCVFFVIIQMLLMKLHLYFYHQ